jgi:transcriptional regulator with XRE-family HTH domain/tetratricopeptide (TPR) repeat protein
MSKNLLLRNERRKRGWSQKLFADFALVSLSTIERAERGEPLRIDNIQRICECLNKTPQELGLVQQEQEAVPSAVEEKNGQNPIATPTLSINSLMNNHQHIMSPRPVLGKPDRSISLQPHAFLDFGILDRLEQAFTPRPQIDLSALDHLQLVVSEFKKQLVQGKQTNWSGLLVTATNQLGLFTNFLESNVERNEQFILLIGETCLLIGDVLFNMHDYGNAERYYHMALRAAQEAPNVALQAIASGRYGLLLVDSKRYSEAENLLEHAIGLAHPSISSVVCSWLWAVKAEAHASKQEEKSCYEALNAAKEYLNLNSERLDCYTFHADLVPSVYGTTKLLGFEGACYLRLKQPGQAQRVLATSQQLSVHPHHQSLIHIDFAQSLIQQSCPQEACAHISQAFNYVQQTGSKRALQRILSIRQDLHRWDKLPEVRDLDEQISFFHEGGVYQHG